MCPQHGQVVVFWLIPQSVAAIENTVKNVENVKVDRFRRVLSVPARSDFSVALIQYQGRDSGVMSME